MRFVVFLQGRSRWSTHAIHLGCFCWDNDEVPSRLRLRLQRHVTRHSFKTNTGETRYSHLSRTQNDQFLQQSPSTGPGWKIRKGCDACGKQQGRVANPVYVGCFFIEGGARRLRCVPAMGMWVGSGERFTQLYNSRRPFWDFVAWVT